MKTLLVTTLLVTTVLLAIPYVHADCCFAVECPFQVRW